ncbi:MAG: tRNA (N(6)-L-threonylcarbamoyladenosine(37)-C(2))-methylthiotransferase MtaB [Thermodesulfobacteriota bacterium]
MAYFRIVTFGCKVNQYESAGIAEALGHRGLVPAPRDVTPDLVIVNTCTVTARADQQARQAIRRLARQFPEARLWVTGCYAQRAPEQIAALPGVAQVFGNQEKDGLPEAYCSGANPASRVHVGDFSGQEPFQACPVTHFPGHTRAWLKVQDGCNHACSYCIVPTVRGRGRSLSLEQVVSALQSLADRGFQEVVLTGIDLGQYGQDLRPRLSLARLLRELAPGPWPFRVRLSSVEPQGITPELMEALSDFPPLCPHFHLPLQSGSPAVLQAMGRPYGAKYFQDQVLELHRRFPGAALGFDVLVGFPGETVSDFEATLNLVQTLPVAYLHVFPFSPRPGTPAQNLARLPSPEVQSRAQQMREVGQRKKTAFYRDQVGKVGEVLVEGPYPGRPGGLKGLSANYLRVQLPGPPEWQNRRLQVKFVHLEAGILRGEVITLEEK